MAFGLVSGQTGGGLSVNGVVDNTYTVAAGETIKKGDLVSYAPNSITSVLKSPGYFLGQWIAYAEKAISDVIAVQVDTSKILLIYSDKSNSNYATAIVITYNTYMLTTVGTPVVFRTNSCNSFSAVTLDSSRVLVSFVNASSSNYGTSVVLGISGTTISVGTPVVYKSAATTLSSMDLITTDTVMLCYRFSNTGAAVVLTVSNTTIAVKSAYNFDTSSAEYFSVKAISSTTALLAYKGASNYGYLKILTVNLDTYAISFGNAATFLNATVGKIILDVVEPNKFIMLYQDKTNLILKCILITISDSTINQNDIKEIYAGDTTEVALCAVNSTIVLAGYVASINTTNGIAGLIYIEDTNMTPKSFGSVSAAVPVAVSIVRLTKSRGVYIYSPNGTKYGRAMAMETAFTLGVAKSGGSGGETIEVYRP